MAIQTATNPETGETVALVNGQWVPVGQTATNDKGQKAYLVNNQWLTDQPVAEPVKEAKFSLSDIAKSFGLGAVGSTKALTDVAGAENVVSSKLGEAAKSIQESLTPERKAEIQRQQERMKTAEKEGTLAEVKAGIRNIAEAPLQSIAQGIGSFVPYLPAMFAAPAAAAMRLTPSAVRAVTAVADAAPKVMGTAQGAGAVKSSIYDSVYEAERAEGASEQVARQKATAAQDYFGKNFDQIALGAGLGLAASSTGVEKLLTPSGKAAAQQGLARRVAGAMAAEAPLEGAQGGQERLAANIAQQREGRDVDTFAGVAGQATQEGLMGALSAGPVAAIRGPGAQPTAEAPPAPPAPPEAPVTAPVAAEPSPTQAIEDQATEFERQQQRQEAAMERARSIGIGGGSEINQTLLEQARIRREQQERAAAAEEKTAEAERQKALRAERVRIGSTRYSADPMMNEVLRSRAIAEFDAANAPKAEEPVIPAFEPTKTIEETTPIKQPKDFNVLRGVDARNADLMSAVAERRATEEAAAAIQTKQAEAQKVAQAAKIDASRADVDQRVAQVENFLMSPVKKTQQETADYMAGVVPEMQKDFMSLLDEDLNQPLTPEQTEALKTQIRGRMRPEVAPEEKVERTPFKKFLASKGMNKQDVQDIFGENAYRANQQLPGAIRSDAPRLDMLAEAAVEAGFLQEEDTEALTQMIKDEFGGDEQVAVDMADDRAAAEYEAQRENELASRAGAIGLNTKGMTPDQIAVRLGRIERKREEQRQRLTREVDGFADMPTAEQDRLVDVAMDQFGEPQIYDVERAEIEGRVRDEDIRYQRSTTGGKSIGKQQTQSVVDAVKSQWANAPEVVVAESMDDPAIPQEVRDHNKAAMQGGAKGSPRGFFYKGKAYVMADAATSSTQVIETLFHESLGHYGLRGTFGPEMGKVLADVVKNRRADVEAKAKEYGLDVNNQKDMLEAAEEVLAEMAQTKPGLTFVKRAIAVIRNFLRDLGLPFKMSDADLIEKYILPARAFVERGERRKVEGEPAAMREPAKAPPTESAAFKKWFGDSKVVDAEGNPLVVYHASTSPIDEFKPKNYGTAGDHSYFYFAASESWSKKFARDSLGVDKPSMHKVYLSIKNPLDLRGESRTPSGWIDFFDGIGVGVSDKLQSKLNAAPAKQEIAAWQLLRFDTPQNGAMRERLIDSGYDGIIMSDVVRGKTDNTTFVSFNPTQIKSATGNIGTYDPENADIRYQRETKLTPNQAAQENLAILDATGMQLQPPEPGRIQNIKDMLRKMGEDPALTKDSAKSAIKKFLDKMEVAAFSGDAAFNNDIRRNLEKDFADNPEVLGMLLEASQSQAVHADALATQFIVDGGIAFDPETKKWVSIKKENNFIKLAKQIEKAAEKYGLNKEQTEQIAHTYFVAKRFKDLLKKQNARDAETDRLKAELEAENANIKQYKKEGDFEKLRTSERAKNDIKADIDKLDKAKVLISDSQRAMIEPGLSLVKNMPELEEISDTWQGIRANAVKAMIDGNLWSMKYAEDMLDNAAYVPFYRDEQLDEGGGPQEFIKGMEVKAEEFRLKGSNAAVNDVFDNMVRWTQYAINRSVRNHKALQMVDIGTDLQVGDRKMAEKVDKMDPKKNTIRVFRDGTQEIYSMADPLYVDAFSAISNVTIPSLKFFTWFSNLLRQSVVLYPLFSVAQVPQDAISAMFTSGLKTRYALRIPALAVKEFVKTLAKTSATHNLLKTYGATGVRDFNAAVARQDIQIAAGLKGAKGVGGKAIEFLSHVAMAADNSVRQAVYEASMQQGLSKGEAIEKAFDIINFRRRGTSKLVNLAGQTVPFFYAYMSVQRTAYKVLTGVGISPQARKEALTTLATTSGAVMALSLLYVMMNGGDEEYEKTPDAVRDRTLNIPGTGGLRIPLRPDLFLMPKVLTEHLYHLITDTGLSDGAKFRKSVADGVANAVLSPQPIPQAVKPAIEVAINYDFFQGRPLIGQFEKQKEAERQFNDNTSEFSKMLGQFGVSPIAADHVIRGMFGSAGGLFLYTTNFMINSDPDVPRPELSFRDALSSLPGTSGFVTKASENALKTDFYALRDEVEKVKNTYNDIKLRSPQELDQFLSDEKNIARLGLAKGTEKIGMQLSKIRRAINQITNAPEDLYSASEKKDAIKELRDVEKEMLKSVDIPALRKMAMM